MMLLARFLPLKMTGTLTEFELLTATGIVHLSVPVYSLLLPESLFLEFLFSAVPQYLAIVFLKHAGLIYLGFGAALSVCFLLEFRKNKSSRFADLTTSIATIPVAKINTSHETNVYPGTNGVQLSNSMSIDRTRFLLISCVAIAVFAADFSFYDSQKLGKSMGYGLKLMDIGVGSFVYNAGFFSVKADSRRKIQNAILAFFLGTLRYLSKVVFKLDVHDAEFGTHMNFFFNLGILNILSMIIDTHFNFIVGFLMCLLHEYFLKFQGLEDLILNNTRSNLITANVEGITFVLPQMGIFLMANGISRVVFSGQSARKVVLYNVFFVLVWSLTRIYSLSCRRLHNLCFCMINMALLTTSGIFFQIANKEFKIRPLKLHRFASKHMLFILLWLNILTGINKSFLDLKYKSDYANHITSFAYLTLVFYIPCVIEGKFKEDNQ